MLFTAKEIATRIAPTEDEIQPAFERVRHWTREGMLSPDGEENPGTGRKRKYAEKELKKARVLNALADLGIALVFMKVAASFLNSATIGINTPESPLFLVIERKSSGKVHVSFHKVDKAYKDSFVDPDHENECNVIVNLTRLFIA